MRTFINWSDIDLKRKRGGVVKTTCPLCSIERSNPKDPCLYVNLDSGVAKCFNCDSLGFREDKHKREATLKVKYDLPSQDWENHTSLHDKFINQFETRKISQQTLIDFNITQEVAYQPKRGKEVINIVFNYFEGDVIVNKKFRSIDKEFTSSKNGKPILYNINSIIGAEEVYCVEGEVDVLSLYEIGIKNVVSLPNGANDNDAFWINSEPYLKDIKKFYIATDMDEKGEAVAEKIAQRLGRYRCERVIFQGKDANEDLQNMVLRESIRNTRKYPTEGTITMEDMADDLNSLYVDGLPKTRYPKAKEFEEVNKIFSTMQGQLTTITGIPSYGKSSYTEWYLLNIAKDYNSKLSFFTPEHTPYTLFHSKMAEKVIGKPFFTRKRYDNGVTRMSKDELNEYIEWSKERIYITSPTKGEVADWDWLLKTFEGQMLRYGVDIFVIDAWNKVMMKNGGGLNEIAQILTKLTQFCAKYNVEIYLIAHPTKMKKLDNGQYDVPNLYDVSGSADFRNQTHNGYIIHRDFERNITLFICGKVKFQFQGVIGESCELIYDEMNGRYYMQGHTPNRKSLLANDYDNGSNIDTSDFITPNDEHYNPFGGLNNRDESFTMPPFEQADLGF